MMRLDAYMAEYWPEYSRSQWQDFIKQGFVQVNSRVVKTSSYKLDEDDIVTHSTLPVASFDEHTLPIVYEDDHVVVINKPAGVLTHAKGAASDEFNVAEFMRPRMAETDNSNRPGIVHRLDRMTSGIIICAKDSETKRLLQKQFQDRKAHKTYLAVVEGVPKLDEATIDLPIERNPKKPSSFRVGPKGKAAITNYRVLSSNGKMSVVELKPLTGRTHQLRVHLAYLGCPIVGDTLYGKSRSKHSLALHAKELEITVPKSQRKIFIAPLPEKLKSLMKEAGYEG